MSETDLTEAEISELAALMRASRWTPGSNEYGNEQARHTAEIRARRGDASEEDRKAEGRLDELFSKAFGTNDPAMLDFVRLKFRVKKAEGMRRKLEAAIQAFEDKERGTPQAHLAAELARELRRALL